MVNPPYIVSKIKLWDGIEEVGVTPSNQLETMDSNVIGVSSNLFQSLNHLNGISGNILNTKQDLDGISSNILLSTNYLYGISSNLYAISSNIKSIKTSIELIDNQESSIIYSSSTMTDTSIEFLPSGGVGHNWRIHHLYCNNATSVDVSFNLRNGNEGVPYFPFYLAAGGGAIAQNLKRPWDLSENKSLYYEYLTGDSPTVYITIGYEDVS